MLKMVGERQHPYRTPLFVVTVFVNFPSKSRMIDVLWYKLPIAPIKCLVNPLFSIMFHRILLLILSKAFSKSIKAMWVSLLNSLRFSIICLSVKTSSVVDHPRLKPICSSSNMHSLVASSL
jgi:hypothetical protein